MPMLTDDDQKLINCPHIENGGRRAELISLDGVHFLALCSHCSKVVAGHVARQLITEAMSPKEKAWGSR